MNCVDKLAHTQYKFKIALTPTLLTSAAGEGTGKGGWVRWGLSSPTSPRSDRRLQETHAGGGAQKTSRSLPPSSLPALEAVGQSGETGADIPRHVQLFELLSKNLI